MSNILKILILADSPGPAESLAAAIPHLKEKSEVKTLAIKTAYPILQRQGAAECSNVNEGVMLLSEFKPNLLLFGISSLTDGPCILNDIVKNAKEQNILILMFQDFWANHNYPSNLEILSYCDAICTIDEFAKQMLQESGFKNPIYIVGNPGYDKFFGLDVPQEQKKLRNKFGVPEDEKVILYAGQGTSSSKKYDKETFSLLCDALRILSRVRGNISLLIRPHPRSEDISYYEELASNIKIIPAPHDSLTDTLLPIADTIVAMFGTNLVHAVILGIPPISIILPKIKNERLSKIFLDDFPLNKTGASIGVYKKSPEILASLLEKVLFDVSFQEELRDHQKNVIRFKPDAAISMRDAIFKFLRTKS